MVGGFSVPGGDSVHLTMNCREKSPLECAKQFSAELWRNMGAALSPGATVGSGMDKEG